MCRKNKLIENNKLAEEKAETNKKQWKENSEVSSRLIVFNIPKYMTEKALADHFRLKGTVTDCKIMRKEKRSRKFAFVGFKDENDAKVAKEYFNDTYLDTGNYQINLLINLCIFIRNEF